MTITKIHELDQSLFDTRGLCYWTCEYLTTHQNPDGAWLNWNTKNYATLRSNTRDFTGYNACFNWARNHRNDAQAGIANYNFPAGALTANHYFRIAVYIGASPMPQTGQNHELMCMTGGGSSVLLFDPNFGFYEIDAAGIAANNNREAIEFYVGRGYGRDENQTAREYVYRDMGAHA